MDPVVQPASKASQIFAKLKTRPSQSPPWFWAFLGLIYAVTAILFLFRPAAIFYLLNFYPKVFHAMEPLPEPSENLTLAFSAAFFAVMAVLSWTMFSQPREKTPVLVHLVGAAVATAGLAYFYLENRQCFAYLLASALQGIVTLILIVTLGHRTFAGGRKI